MSLVAQIESILSVANHPLSVKKLMDLTGAAEPEMREAVRMLGMALADKDRGVALVTHGADVQIATKGEHTELVSRFLKEERVSEMTKPQLETLTIVAYRGPIAKTELEQIRGVNCSLILRNLMIRGLVEEAPNESPAGSGGDGRNGAASWSRRYRVTIDFIKHLGLTSVKDLPDYEALARHEFIEEVVAKANAVSARNGAQAAEEETVQ